MFFKRKTEDLELLPPPAPEDIEKPEGFDEIIRESRNSPEVVRFAGIADSVEKPKKKEKTAKVKAKNVKSAKKQNEAPDSFGPDAFNDLKFDEMPDITDDISTVPLLGHDVPYPTKELDDAKNEIREAIEKIKRNEKKSLFGRLLGKKTSTPEVMPYQAPIPADNLSLVKAKIAIIRESLMKLETETAKMLYKEVLETYNSMDHEDQSKVYNDIKEVYFERKSAEQFKNR